MKHDLKKLKRELDKIPTDQSPVNTFIEQALALVRQLAREQAADRGV
mgnify:CR=1 FL=1